MYIKNIEKYNAVCYSNLDKHELKWNNIRINQAEVNVIQDDFVHDYMQSM